MWIDPFDTPLRWKVRINGVHIISFSLLHEGYEEHEARAAASRWLMEDRVKKVEVDSSTREVNFVYKSVLPRKLKIR